MVQKQKKLKSKDWYVGLLILRIFKIDGMNRKLIIPVELNEEQYTLINKFYKLEGIRKLEHSSVLIEKVEEIVQRTIKQQVRLGKRYFKRHPDKWVQLAKPIKIKDEEIKLHFTLVKMRGK